MNKFTKKNVISEAYDVLFDIININNTRQRIRSAAAGDEVIRGPYNSNRQSSYVELVLVIDNSVFKVHKTLAKVHEYCKALTNIVNAVSQV